MRKWLVSSMSVHSTYESWLSYRATFILVTLKPCVSCGLQHSNYSLITAFGVVLGKVDCLRLWLMPRRAMDARHLSTQRKWGGKEVSTAAKLCLACSHPGSLSLEINFKMYVLLWHWPKKLRKAAVIPYKAGIFLRYSQLQLSFIFFYVGSQLPKKKR